MAPQSTAGIFFDQIQKSDNPFGLFKSWIKSTPPRVETEWLDFKGGGRLSDDKIKEIWSKSLTAFANVQGGVLIWGLSCKKAGDPPVDQVEDFDLATEPEAFASRLMELHHQATEPPVLGVKVVAYACPDDPKKGVVVCYIPESSIRPHRAEYAQKQYYIRAGDDTVVPSVSLLRALFVPTSSALLVPSVRSETYDVQIYPNTITNLRFHCHVRNSGLVSVEGALVTLHGNFVGDFRIPQDWRKHDTAISPISFESPRSIFPGEMMQVFSFFYGTPIRRAGEKNYSFPKGFAQAFELRVYSHNQNPIVARIIFSEDDIVHNIRKACVIEELSLQQ